MTLKQNRRSQSQEIKAQRQMAGHNLTEIYSHPDGDKEEQFRCNLRVAETNAYDFGCGGCPKY